MRYVQTAEQTARFARSLNGARLLAADTEAAGYHRYHDRICLLQVSTREDTALVDTLAVRDIAPLKPYFEDPEIEIIFHDADYDLRLLSRDYGVLVRGLFDTKIAAQLLGEPAFGLGNLLEKYLGVKLEKKYQRADWAQRPLPPELLEYAAEDTRYLPVLRDRLKAELEMKGRTAWADEEFRIEEQVHWAPGENNGEAYLRLKGIRDLRPRQLAALRELYRWREAVAAERDRAAFRILPNEALLGIAREMPASTAELARVPEVAAPFVERYGPELLAAVARAPAARERPAGAAARARTATARPQLRCAHGTAQGRTRHRRRRARPRPRVPHAALAAGGGRPRAPAHGRGLRGDPRPAPLAGGGAGPAPAARPQALNRRSDRQPPTPPVRRIRLPADPATSTGQPPRRSRPLPLWGWPPVSARSPSLS